MILKLDIERVRTVDEVRDFMAGSEPVDFHLTERRGAYDFVTRTLRRLSYAGLTKADTRKYAEAYCRISSYLQSMANQGYNPLVAIQIALAGRAVDNLPE